MVRAGLKSKNIHDHLKVVASSPGAKRYVSATVPAEGPVRAQDDTITVDYGEHGGVSTCQLTGDHSVAVISPDLPPVAPTSSPPEIDEEAAAMADLLAQRERGSIRFKVCAAGGSCAHSSAHSAFHRSEERRVGKECCR